MRPVPRPTRSAHRGPGLSRRRVLAALLPLALVAAACGGDDDPEPPLAGEAETSTVPDGAPDTQPTIDAGGDATGAPAPDGEPPTDAPGSPPSSTASTALGPTDTTAPAPPPAAGPVGGFAGFYLRPAESAALLVHVAHHGDAAPRQGTLDHLATVLGAVSGKAVAVEVVSIPGAARSWSGDDLRALADEHGPPQSRERAVLDVLFLRGGFAESDLAVGVAVRSDVVAVFPDRVDEAAGLLGNPGAVEDAVTIHELGHVLGLVDLVLDTGREDPDHPGHSPNRDSVMYYAVESTLIGSVLSGGPPREFDDADLADLAAIRGS